jgi:hypothetical protein
LPSPDGSEVALPEEEAVEAESEAAELVALG